MKRDSIVLVVLFILAAVSSARAETDSLDLNAFHRSMVEGHPEYAVSMLERSPADSDSTGNLLLLARAYLESGRAKDCVRIAESILATNQDGESRRRALTLLVMAEEGDRLRDAALSLVESAEEDDLIADYLAYLSARALKRADALNDAAAAFHHAYSISTDRTLKSTAVEALGDALAELHDYPASERSFLEAHALSSTDADKARVLYKRAGILKRLDRRREVLDVLAGVVNNFPSAPDAERALGLLRELDKTHTSRYRQGMVLYHAGKYERAVDFFDYYLKYEKSGGTVSYARYFLARSLQRSGQYRRAVAAYRKFLESHPGHEYRHFAWLREGYCLESSGETDAAKAKYLSYPESYPAGAWADRCLWYAAELLKKNDELEEASSVYLRIASEYPASEFSLRATVKSAICLWDAGKTDETLAMLKDLAGHSEGSVTSAASYWYAKLSGVDHPDSPEYLLRSWETDPWGFYGRRAIAALNGRRSAVTNQTGSGASLHELAPADSISSPESERWFAEMTSHGNPSVRPRQLLEDNPYFARGMRLMEFGLYDDAEAQFERARLNLDDDPELLFHYANQMSKLGFHRLSILAAIKLSGHVPGGRSEAPLTVRRLLNPVGYATVIETAARENGLSPQLLFALIRQESFFNRKAVSRAGARGLSQIMPSTGRDLARELRVRGYSTSRLFDAETNVNLGAHYLSKLIDHYGDEFLALAAYNAGETNVDRWIQRSGCADPDFVIEEIGFDETYGYVRTVHTVSEIYEHIWRGHLGAPVNPERQK
jgi:soluble lytic murein transglycosylase